MRSDLMALRLILEELGVPAEIGSLDDRKRVQKAVYLVQEAGLGLGYSYGWYLYGPYSTQLTSDYYALDAERRSLGAEAPKYKLVASAKSSVDRVRPLMEVPTSIGDQLTLEDWLELLASYHFLRRSSGYDDGAAREALTKHPRKNRLAPYADEARRQLLSVGLLAE